ncbi:hypothetical protein MHYP_G00146350 [Metynnis hypsauchen]
MFQSLSDLEETAVKLDKMKKGSSIYTVTGSSVGIAGGVFSIVGLALAAITAGVSLALTLTGVGMGVTSGVNSLVTGITEMAVNIHHGENAKSIFQRFMKDVQKVQDCLEQVVSQCPLPNLDEGGIGLGAVRVIASAMTVGKGIDALVDGASAVKALRSAANVGVQEAKATRNIPNLAADLPVLGRHRGLISWQAVPDLKFLMKLKSAFFCEGQQRGSHHAKGLDEPAKETSEAKEALGGGGA